jgi:chromosome partitioning protein
VIVPMQVNTSFPEGLTDLVTIKQVHANLNKDLQIIGLLCRCSARVSTLFSNSNSEQLKDHFGDSAFNTVIPRNVWLMKHPAAGCLVWWFDPASKGAQVSDLLRRPKRKMVARIATMK